MEKTKITLDYTYGVSKDNPDEIVIGIKNTGIDLDNEQHKKFMEVLMNIIGTHMYAHAHGIDFRQVVQVNGLPPKNGN